MILVSASLGTLFKQTALLEEDNAAYLVTDSEEQL